MRIRLRPVSSTAPNRSYSAMACAAEMFSPSLSRTVQETSQSCKACADSLRQSSSSFTLMKFFCAARKTRLLRRLMYVIMTAMCPRSGFASSCDFVLDSSDKSVSSRANCGADSFSIRS